MNVHHEYGWRGEMQIIVLLQPRASDAGFYSFLRIGAVSWASLTAKDSDVD